MAVGFKKIKSDDAFVDGSRYAAPVSHQQSC
jgi:hypothetical protein